MGDGSSNLTTSSKWLIFLSFFSPWLERCSDWFSEWIYTPLLPFHFRELKKLVLWLSLVWFFRLDANISAENRVWFKGMLLPTNCSSVPQQQSENVAKESSNEVPSVSHSQFSQFYQTSSNWTESIAVSLYIWSMFSSWEWINPSVLFIYLLV